MKKHNVLFLGDLYIKENEFTLGDGLKDLLLKCDLVSCNLEAPLSDGKSVLTKIGPSLYQDRKVISFLQSQNITFFNLANNHIMDYGKEGLRQTLSLLPVDSHVGAGLKNHDSYDFVIKMFGSIKVAFLSLSEWSFGVCDAEGPGFAWINHHLVKEKIFLAKKQADYVFIQCHGGVENISIPLPEWRIRYRELIDYGADLIIGHHPHVPQGFELYKGKYIYYSLGNFFMDYKNAKSSLNIIVSVEFTKTSFSSKVIPVRLLNNRLFLTHDKKDLNHIDDLSIKLSSPYYEDLVNKECLKLWDSYYRTYYNTALGVLSFKNPLVYNLRILLNILNFKRIDKLFLLHNLAIESHRYVVMRVLRR